MRINRAYWIPIVLGLLGVTGGCADEARGSAAGPGYLACESSDGECAAGCEKDGNGGCEPLPAPPALEDGGVPDSSEPDTKDDTGADAGSDPEPDSKPDVKPPACDGGSCEPEEPPPVVTPPPVVAPPPPPPPVTTPPPPPPPVVIGGR